MNRRQKRNPPRVGWKPILWILLLANVTAGLLYSPLTAIRTVRVQGAWDWDRPRVESIIVRLQDIPCAQVNAAQIESDVLSDPEVRSAHLDRNLFGSAVLSMGYRQAVAQLAARRNVVVARDGILYPSHVSRRDLPSLIIDGGDGSSDLTLAWNWPAVQIARLAMNVRSIGNGRAMAIELGKDGSVCLNMDAGRVVLGSCDDMDAKLAALRRILKKDPLFLSKFKSLNLVVASAPTAVPVSSKESK